MLKPGLYEQGINQKLDKKLSKTPAAQLTVAHIDEAESTGVLTMSKLLEESL